MTLFLIKILILLIFLLVAVAYFTLVERKIMASVQRRRGPNVIGIYGLLQPLADGLKLFLKENIIPSVSNKSLYLFAPIFWFAISLVGWAVFPFNECGLLLQLDLSSLFILVCSAVSVYGILLAGWSSNSKYAFLGALRSTAQVISYELTIGILVNVVVVCCGSFNLNDFIEKQYETGWFLFYFFPIFLIFFICVVAETNRHPFDLPEAEAELVSGYNVEYSAMGFALFSLGEYSNILKMSIFVSVLFLGGWSIPFIVVNNYILQSIIISLKIVMFVILFVILRAALPRYRYDQLMELGWQVFLIPSFFYYILIFIFLWVFGGLPL